MTMGRLIEANALLSEMEKYSDDTASSKNDYLFGMQQRLETCIELVEDAPTVDAVEVVRCRDCKNSEHWYADRRRCFLWHENGVSVFDGGFCNYGERKDGDNHG